MDQVRSFIVISDFT